MCFLPVEVCLHWRLGRPGEVVALLLPVVEHERGRHLWVALGQLAAGHLAAVKIGRGFDVGGGGGGADPPQQRCLGIQEGNRAGQLYLTLNYILT